MGRPNMTMDEILAAMRSNELEFFKRFSNTCRVESQEYSAH